MENLVTKKDPSSTTMVYLSTCFSIAISREKLRSQQFFLLEKNHSSAQTTGVLNSVILKNMCLIVFKLSRYEIKAEIHSLCVEKDEVDA